MVVQESEEEEDDDESDEVGGDGDGDEESDGFCKDPLVEVDLNNILRRRRPVRTCCRRSWKRTRWTTRIWLARRRGRKRRARVIRVGISRLSEHLEREAFLAMSFGWTFTTWMVLDVSHLIASASLIQNLWLMIFMPLVAKQSGCLTQEFENAKGYFVYDSGSERDVWI